MYLVSVYISGENRSGTVLIPVNASGEEDAKKKAKKVLGGMVFDECKIKSVYLVDGRDQQSLEKYL